MSNLPRARSRPNWTRNVLLLAVALFFPLLSIGCGGGEAPPQEVAPPEEPTAPAEEREEELPDALFPPDPGKSGVIGSGEVEEPALAFSPLSGQLTPLPEAVVARDSLRAVVDRGGALALYDEERGGEPRWMREAHLPLLVLQEERLITATDGGVVALGLEAGEELWRVALDSSPRQLRSRGEAVVVAGGRSVIWLSADSGRVIARRSLAGEAQELLLGESLTYVGSSAGLEGYNGEQELLWSYEAPGITRATLGSKGVILLESSGGIVALDGESGEPLWEEPGRTLPFRPLIFGESVILGREEGVLEAYGARSGLLRWSRGVAPAIGERPRQWQGRIWLAGSRGRLLSLSYEGDLIGSLESGREEIAFLYGNGERLGVVDQFGRFLELTPKGGEIELSLQEEGGAPFELPPLRAGDGPLLIELREEPVSVEIEEGEEGIYLFRLPLQEQTETIIDLIGEDGSLVGSNLDKIELAETFRIRLEGGEGYSIEVRPAREELAGELTSVSLQLLRREG